MEIIRSGKIFAGINDSKLAKTCFPFLCQLANGDIMASFQTASVKNGIDSNAAVCRSTDMGETWSEPKFLFNPEINGKLGVLHFAYISQIQEDRLAASLLWCDHQDDASLEFFNSKTGGLLSTEACVSFSNDNGLSWSKLHPIEKGKLNNTPTPVMGPVQLIDSGMLICPFETSKEYNDGSVWHHKAGYFISYDNGKTWPEYKVVAYDPECKIYYWDHRLLNLGEGNLIDLFWAYDAVNNKELNAYISKSVDFGKTWSIPSPTEIVGQPWPIRIGKNTFAVVAVDRNISQTIKLYLTNNGGKTFDAGEPVLIYNNQKIAQSNDKLNEQLVEMSNWSYGLPSGIRLSDGTIMIVYYAGSENTTDICWCKVGL